MTFAKFFRNLTACSVALWLVACANQTTQVDFNRSEAVKARINLALAYLEQSDFPKAKENIDKALEHDVKDYLRTLCLPIITNKLAITKKQKKPTSKP